MLKTTYRKTGLAFVIFATLATVNISMAADTNTHNHRHTIVDRKTDKVKTDNGFTRTTTKTDDQGVTATHKTNIAFNKAEGSRTTTTSGTTFDGKTYNGESTAHKTDSGFVSQGHLTTSDGKVINRSVNATVDKSAGTVTEEISLTPQGGETKTRTVVHPLKKHE